jgi:4-hydroxy-tetrahydrodipicolinate synthase
MKEIKGVLCLMTTPLTEDYELNEHALRREVDWVIENGGDGIIPMGSVGEFSHFLPDERKKIISICIDQAKNKTLTIAGTSADTTHEAIEYTKYAEDLGYDGAIVIPPYYWKATEEEVYTHYKMISDATKKIQIVLYNNPNLSKFDMSPAFVRKLADIERVTTMKDSDHDITRTFFVADKINVLRTPVWFLYGLLTGGVGGTISPFVVPACAEIYKLFKQGKLDEALELQRKVSLTKPFTIMQGEAGVGWLGRYKIASSIVTGIPMGPPRLPYKPRDETYQEIKTSFQKLGLIK